jgi:Gas vesicle synthesis protein GvpL/GvpF
MTDTTPEPTQPTGPGRPPYVYVYCIVDADHPCRVDYLEGVGQPPGALRRLAAGRLAAVVSDAPAELRAKRRDVLAHQHVLEELLRQGTVLPMRFGVVARDEESLRNELTEDVDLHQAMLTELKDRVELNVKVFSDEDELIRQIATTDPMVRQLRAQETTSVEDQIRLGEAVAAGIDARHEAITHRLFESLDPLAVRSIRGAQVKGAAANASFLVERQRMAEFVDMVDKLDADFGPDIRLQRSGSLPPYSFVDVRE